MSIRGAVASDEAFEDIYLEFLEADQAFVNLMNAMEIAEKAQTSGSMECMNFAEELLGASCEVVLSEGSAKMTEHAQAAIYTTVKTLEHLKSQCERIKNNKALSDKSYECPQAVIWLHNSTDALDKLSRFDATHHLSTRTLPLRDAALIFSVAIEKTIKAFLPFCSKQAATKMRAEFLKDEHEARTTKWMKGQREYGTRRSRYHVMRNYTSRFLKDIRNFIRFANNNK